MTTYRPAHPLDVRRTLAPLSRGAGDPTSRRTPDGAYWRVTRTTDGPATLRITQQGGQIMGEAWGPGAERALVDLPELLGARDDQEGFDPQHPLLREACRRHPGLRLLRTGRVVEALVPAILEQKVTGKEAFSAQRTLLLQYGEVAPGPTPSGMRVPPPPAVWRTVPSWDWHRAAVDPRRMRTVLAAMQVAGRLEEATAMSRDLGRARLQVVPGIGIWTAAEVAQRAWGDPDAVSVGDFHVAAAVGWALIGRPVDDDGMLELLAPWEGHRQRVVRLLALTGIAKPRFGPKITIQDHRDH